MLLETSGLEASGVNFGIPPQYIIDIVDGYTGEVVVPLPTPEYREGRVEGGHIVAEAVVSRAEADRIQRQIAFTAGEEQADVADVQMRMEEMALDEDRSTLPCEPSLGPATGAGPSPESRSASPSHWEASPASPLRSPREYQGKP